MIDIWKDNNLITKMSEETTETPMLDQTTAPANLLETQPTTLTEEISASANLAPGDLGGSMPTSMLQTYFDRINKPILIAKGSVNTNQGAGVQLFQDDISPQIQFSEEQQIPYSMQYIYQHTFLNAPNARLRLVFVCPGAYRGAFRILTNFTGKTLNYNSDLVNQIEHVLDGGNTTVSWPIMGGADMGAKFCHPSHAKVGSTYRYLNLNFCRVAIFLHTMITAPGFFPTKLPFMLFLDLGYFSVTIPRNNLFSERTYYSTRSTTQPKVYIKADTKSFLELVPKPDHEVEADICYNARHQAMNPPPCPRCPTCPTPTTTTTQRP